MVISDILFYIFLVFKINASFPLELEVNLKLYFSFMYLLMFSSLHH